MFVADDQPLPFRDIVKILYEIEFLSLEEHSSSVDYVGHNSKKAISNDEIKLVNSMHKDKDMNTWMVN